MTMKCTRFNDPGQALGAAVNLLRRVQPYASYPFGRFSNVLMGQIQRKHYAFAIDEGVPIGYAGWALCAESVARAWTEGRHVPSSAECQDGDSAMLITFHAANRQACFRLVRYCRSLRPGIKVFAIRDYGTHQRPLRLMNRRCIATPEDFSDQELRLVS